MDINDCIIIDVRTREEFMGGHVAGSKNIPLLEILEHEEELKKILTSEQEPTIILRVEEGVPIEDAVYVMDIANRNSFKVVLAVRPK